MLKQLMLIFVVAMTAAAAKELRAEEAQAEQQTEEQAEFQLTETEQAVLDMANAERARRGLKPLVIDPALVQSAREHAIWMTSHGMRHTWKPVGENIAMGQNSVADVMRTWMNSSGHRANILGGWNKIGGAAYSTPGGRIYWCLQFLR
ncbi:MAG: CAP domain-containing protein [Planctomycetaceae bacterium]|nr:CAP domain-containing protein [Planctomycetaceae bacterium]